MPAKEPENGRVNLPASLTLDELARQQGVRPVASVEDLRADIWASDEELEAFLTEMRESRNADLA